MRDLTENPYTNIEIQDMFEKQRDKVPFELVKYVTDNDGDKWQLRIAGKSIKENTLNVIDIWNDDYILFFDGDTKNKGYGHGHNRFTNIEDLKKHIFDTFHLEEPQQISFFD